MHIKVLRLGFKEKRFMIERERAAEMEESSWDWGEQLSRTEREREQRSLLRPQLKEKE